MKKFKTNITLFVMALALISCEDQLDIQPYDLIGADAAFSSATDLESGALGAYAVMSGQNIYSINALMTDNLRRAASNTGQGMQLFNHNVVASDGTVTGAWANAYQVIDRINRVLGALESVEATLPADVALKNQVEGEMLALRAYQHFDLFRNFANYNFPDNDGLVAPYMTESQISLPERDTKADFFQKLNQDITDAEAILDDLTLSNERMNITALTGLKARLALYTGQWDDAITFATDVIDAVPLTSSADYPNLWDDTIEGEVIFKLANLTPADGTISIFERAGNDDVFFYASNELVNLYDQANDVRFTTFFDNTDPAAVRIMKYNRIPGLKNVADIKMMRVSEMYLIRAEAYAQNDDPVNAALDITALRAQRVAGAPATVFANQQDALNGIRLESRLELAFEGHRFYDLKRADLPVTRIPADIDGATTSNGIAADSYLFVLPIPQDELFANENMTQNPGDY